MTGEQIFENLATPLLIVGAMYLCQPGYYVAASRLRKYSAERLGRLRRSAATLDRYFARLDSSVVWGRRAVGNGAGAGEVKET